VRYSTTTMTNNALSRVLPLEGLRGLAAINVALYHFLVLVFPAMYYGSTAVQHSRFEDNLHGNPILTLVSGTFAVSIFFVLSGFVLTVGYLQTKSSEVIRRLATRRYIRLMVPALASVVLAWALIALGLSHVEKAYGITQSAALNLSWTQNTSLPRALYEGSIAVFTGENMSNFNSVLWTMKYEFLGSFIVFALAVLVGASKYRLPVYLFLLLALINTWFVGFILGMMIADLYVNKRRLIEKLHPALAGAMVVVAVFLGGYPWAGVEETIYRHISVPGFTVLQNQAAWGALGAALLILAVFRIGMLSRLLSSRLMVKAGSYTYSMYLVHQPIIYTLGMALFVSFSHRMGYVYAAAASMPLTFVVIAIATFVFHRYVELPAIRLSSHFDLLVNDGESATKAWERVFGRVRRSTERSKRRSA
jgi:peptidoglycan/LPS O-acetylase OafA/YrhL